jgi:manganese transport protein
MGPQMAGQRTMGRQMAGQRTMGRQMAGQRTMGRQMRSRQMRSKSDAEAVDQPKPASSGPSQSLLAVLGLMGTTFSVAGAFYQSYLVREKGWGLADVKRGFIDSVAGISVLGTITLVIMLTSAISFYGKDVQLKSAADVAMQLKPLFGPFAVILFSVGIFAGSFSSFLVNAMIGGAMMADGLGLGGKMDALPTKIFTAAALLTGMLVAAFVPADDRVGLVVFAQALVVIGFPLLAASMLYLATRPDLTGPRRIPLYLKLIAVLGLVVVLLSAGRLGWTLIWS